MKVRNTRQIRYKGQASEILPSMVFEDYEIKVLRHGNTGHILYRAPRLEDLEPCWTMDLTTAQNGVLKLKEQQTSSSDLQSSK